MVIGGKKAGAGQDFDAWYREVEPPLRHALVATYGRDLGREATAEAMAWAWDHQDRLPGLEQPVAHLYRVGQSRSRRWYRRLIPQRLPPPGTWVEPWVEPGLPEALAGLTERQRVTVLLVHAYDWTLAEVAELLGLQKTTAQNHLERGVARLRSQLKATPDA